MAKPQPTSAEPPKVDGSMNPELNGVRVDGVIVPWAVAFPRPEWK